MKSMAQENTIFKIVQDSALAYDGSYSCCNGQLSYSLTLLPTPIATDHGAQNRAFRVGLAIVLALGPKCGTQYCHYQSDKNQFHKFPPADAAKH